MAGWQFYALQDWSSTTGPVLQATVSDGVGLNDATTPAIAAARIHADFVGLLDAVTFAKTRSLPDLLGLLDSHARAQGYIRRPVAPLGTVDLASPSIGHSRSHADLSGLQDLATVARGKALSTIDAEHLTDSHTRTTAVARGALESLALSEVLVRKRARPLTSIAGSTDSLTPLLARVYRAGEVLGLLDRYVGTLRMARTAVDPLGVLDSYGAAATGSLTRAVTSPAGLMDMALPRSRTIRTLTDGLSLAEILARTYGRGVIADTLTFSDTTSRLMAVRRAVAELVGMTEQMAVAAFRRRVVGDLFGLSDAATVATMRVVSRVHADALGFVDPYHHHRGRALLDGLGLLDPVVSPTARLTRTLASVVGVGDASASRVARSIAIAEGLGLVDTAAAVPVLSRAFADAIGLTGHAVPRVIVFGTAPPDSGPGDARLIDVAGSSKAVLMGGVQGGGAALLIPTDAGKAELV